MKLVKKLLATIVSLAMVITMLPAMALAADSVAGPHVSCVASATSVEQGDTFTVTLKTSQMTISSFTGGIHYDPDLVSVESLDTYGVLYSIDQTKGNLEICFDNSEPNVGGYGIGVEDTTYAANDKLVTVTFRANYEGDAVFTLYEDVDGTDAYKSDNIEGTTVTVTSEDYVTYVQANGTSTTVYSSNIKSCTQTGKGNYRLRDVLNGLDITSTANCCYKITGDNDPGYSVNLDADTYDDMALYYDNDGWHFTYDTNTAGFEGDLSKLDGHITITEQNHEYGTDHQCANAITTGIESDGQLDNYPCGEEDTYIPYESTAGCDNIYGATIKSCPKTENGNYLLSDVLAAAGITTTANCCYQVTISSGSVLYDADYYNDLALYEDENGEWGFTFDTNAPGYSYEWYKIDNVKSIAARNHNYDDDHICTNYISAGPSYYINCGTEEEHITYIAADGTQTKLYTSVIESCDRTDNDNFLLSDVLKAAGVTTTAECTYQMVGGSDGYTVYYDAEYYDDMALYYSGGWRSTYDTNAPGLSGGWYKVSGLTTITEQNHVYGEDHTCTNVITTGRDKSAGIMLTEVCGAEEDHITYIAADGTETPIYASVIKSCTLTDNNNYLLSDVLAAAGVTTTAECTYQMVGSGDYTVYYDADYYADMALYYSGGWRCTYDTNAPGLIGGWYKVSGLTTITEQNHVYGEDHTCTNEITTGRDKSAGIMLTEVCGAEDSYITYVSADGTQTKIYGATIKACDLTDNNNYLLSDVLAAAGITTTAECRYQMVGSGDYTVYYDADYYDDMALYYSGGWRCTYDTNAPGLSGGWYKVSGLTTITEGNHVYGDAHTCTNEITTGRDKTAGIMLTEACGAEEEHITYIAADGTETKLYTSVIEGCDLTENNNYLLSDVLAAAGVSTTADCSYQMTSGGDGYTVYYDADYYTDMALYYKGGWRSTFDTNAPGFEGGWYKVGNLATITEQNHVYGDNHTCTNLITTGRDATTKETLTKECGVIGTGIVAIDGMKFYYVDGVLQSDVVDVIKVDGKWYNIVDGIVTAGPTVAKNSNGWFYINADGVVDFTYTGFAENKNGWWYIENGKVTFAKKDVIKDTAKTIDGTASWYFVSGSKVQFGVTSVEKNSKGWWYIKNGKVDFTYTGVAKNANGWWRIENGKVNFNFTGLAKNDNGWWYLKNGKVDFTYNGLATNSNGTWLVQKGKVNFSFTGTAYGKKIVNGKVQ